MNESLATTLREYLGDNPLVLMENADGTTRNYFLSDPDLETAAREVVKRVAPACIQCGVAMIFVEASDFRGWSCADTPCCVFRIPLGNLPQNASTFPRGRHEPSHTGRSRNSERESTRDPIGRGGEGDSFAL